MSNHNHAVQTQYAKAELEKIGKPLPIDRESDILSLPELPIDPHPYLYQRVPATMFPDLWQQHRQVYGAMVANEDGTTEARYYVKRATGYAK